MFCKRIILPILIIIPYRFQYILFIFMIGFTSLDILFANKKKFNDKFNRLLIYRIS
jgi:hypothetical protein